MQISLLLFGRKVAFFNNHAIITIMNDKNGKNALDESLRRLGGIFSSPSLVTCYEHTTPLLERSFLRRIGLTKDEAALFLEKMCEHGMLDGGARALLERVCAERRLSGAEAARLLLRDVGWPEKEA